MPNTGYGARNIVTDVTVRVTARDDASKTIGRIAGGLKAFATSAIARQIGTSMETAGRAILGVVGNVEKMTIGFQQSMALVQTQAQLGTREFAQLTSDALHLAGQFPQSAQDIANGLYDVFSSLDVGSKEAITLVEAAAKAATAGGTDIRTTVRGLASELNAFSLPVSSVNHLLDIQFQMVKRGVGTYEEFVSALGNVNTSAHTMNQSIGTMSGAIAFMSRTGLTASEAATSVSRALDQLVRHREDIKKGLGIDIVDHATGKYKQLTQIMSEFAVATRDMTGPEKIQKFLDVFGAGRQEANKFFRATTNNIGKFNNMVSSMGGPQVAGQMQKAWDIMRNTPAVKLEILVNRIKAVAMSIGAFFVPGLTRLLDMGQKVADWVDSLSPKVKQMIAQWVVGAGVFLLVSGRLIRLFAVLKGFQALLLLSKMSFATWVVQAGSMLLVISLLSGMAFLVVRNWSKVGPFFMKLLDQVKSAFDDAFGGMRRWWDDNGAHVTAKLLDLAKAFGAFLAQALVDLAPILRGVFDTLQAMVGVLLAILGPLFKIGAWLLEKLNPAFKFLGAILPTVVASMVALKIVNTITTYFGLLTLAAKGLTLSMGAASVAAAGEGGFVAAMGAAAAAASGLLTVLAPLAAAAAAVGTAVLISKTNDANKTWRATAATFKLTADNADLLHQRLTSGFFGVGPLREGQRMTLVVNDINRAYQGLLKNGLLDAVAQERINDAIRASGAWLGNSMSSLREWEYHFDHIAKVGPHWHQAVYATALDIDRIGTALLEPNQGLQRFRDAMIGATNVTGKQTVKIAAMVSGLYAMGGSLTALNAKQISNLLTMGDYRDALELLKNILEANTAALGDTRDAQQRAKDATAEQTVKVNGLRLAYEKLARTNPVIRKKFILLGADGLISDLSYINRLITTINNNPISVSAYRVAGGQGVGHALGTQYAQPGWSWVGETQPELVYFRGGETVASGVASRRMAQENGLHGKGSSGNEIHLHFHGMQRMDVQSAMREVDYRMKTGGL